MPLVKNKCTSSFHSQSGARYSCSPIVWASYSCCTTPQADRICLSCCTPIVSSTAAAQSRSHPLQLLLGPDRVHVILLKQSSQSSRFGGSSRVQRPCITIVSPAPRTSHFHHAHTDTHTHTHTHKNCNVLMCWACYSHTCQRWHPCCCE